MIGYAEKTGLLKELYLFGLKVNGLSNRQIPDIFMPLDNLVPSSQVLGYFTSHHRH